MPEAVVVVGAVVRATAVCATVDVFATPEGGVNDARRAALVFGAKGAVLDFSLEYVQVVHLVVVVVVVRNPVVCEIAEASRRFADHAPVVLGFLF